MLLLNYGFKWKKENCTWRHPFVITDKGSKKLSFSNVRLIRTKKLYMGLNHFFLKKISKPIFPNSLEKFEKWLGKKFG